jgi:NOL1/NOP2/fmu family ribosome biogenesis protein
MFRNKSAVDEWSSINTAHCAERQKRILMDIWPALKENGILIYSTCTFNPGENEENIRWLTGKHQSESIRMNIDNFTGITEIGYMGIYGYGFYPDKVRGEGFFVSVVRKTGKQEKFSVKNQRVSELRPGRSEMEAARSWTIFSEDRFLRWGDDVFAVPGQMDDYVYLFQNLNIVKAGTKIFSVKHRDYLPSPELALSQYIKKNAFPLNEISLGETVSYLRRDNITLHGISKGWSIVKYKGVNVGFINNIGNRINNYFPVEWRIRLDASALSSATAITWK